MTAKVIPLRRPPAGPCVSGTVPGGVSAPCGRKDTRLYAGGPRCPDHPPASRKQLAVPLLPTDGDAA